ncbi:hypothetical protein COO00_18880 [Bacillus toyonensis]|nr:hypothetical protein CON93_07095 [Bacillus toyonensis]PEA71055.1 hypothetical protein COO00_18880 [Bacillus toyonensis]
MYGGSYMNFDSNWNTKAVFHHLVSQTYLKGWKYKDSSVYYIEKNDVNIKDNWSRKTRRLAGINNFFSRRAGALFRTEKDCVKFFEPLKDFKVEYKGQILNNPLDLNDNFSFYDSWIIYDFKSQIVSKSEKEKLKFEIDNIHVRDIEVGWDRLYENNWPNVRNDIMSAISSNPGAIKVPSVRREELIKFMVSLEWRSKPTHPLLEATYEPIASSDLLKDCLNVSIPEIKRMYPFLDTEKEFVLHNILLKWYHKFLNDSGKIYDEAQMIIKQMNIELLIVEKGSEFITSDNPVCRFLNSNNDLEYIFPITPEIACAVRKANPYDGNHYFVRNLSKDEVFKYNQKLKDNCYKGYILHQSSLTYYFK